MTHPSLLFLALFSQPSAKSPAHRQTRSQLQVHSHVQKRGDKRVPARKFARSPIWGGWNQLDSPLSFHPSSILPRFFQTISKRGFAFNARRRVLKNWTWRLWVYTDWLIVCAEFWGYDRVETALLYLSLRNPALTLVVYKCSEILFADAVQWKACNVIFSRNFGRIFDLLAPFKNTLFLSRRHVR